MSTVAVHLPLNVACWQGVCLHCEARYALMHTDFDEAPRPQNCPFCGHRAVYSRAEVQPE